MLSRLWPCLRTVSCAFLARSDSHPRFALPQGGGLIHPWSCIVLSLKNEVRNSFGMRMTDVLAPANLISRIAMRALFPRSIGELDSGIRDARIMYPDC